MNDIIRNGYSFIEKECQKGFFNCYLSSSRKLDDFNDYNKSEKEIGSSALILMNSSGKNKKNGEIISYLAKKSKRGKFHFYEDGSLLPDDTDTSAWTLTALFLKRKLSTNFLIKAAKNFIDNVDQNGLILVYFEPCARENRLDHVAMTNVLYLLSLVGMDKQAKPSLNYVLAKLETREYLNGSRYYYSPLTFLYFFSRLFDFKDFQQFQEIIKNQLTERPSPEYPLDLSYRIMISKKLGINCENEINLLTKFQADDGGWPFDGIYRFGKKEQYFGSRAITTSFALKALET